MILQNLNLINFRNYREMSISFPPGGALLEGVNGAGKTNLLEAIYLLCTGRSQRGAARNDMIAHGEECAFAEGVFCDDRSADDVSSADNYSVDSDITASSNNCSDDNDNTILSSDVNTIIASLGFSRDKKVVMKRGGVDVNTFSEWFGERPVVSFGTDDLELVYGAPDSRRKFLDMLLSQMDHSYLNALTSYRKSMACRNALFSQTNDSAQFELYERAMAEAASTIVLRRTEAIIELQKHAVDFYEKISGAAESVGLEYVPKIKHDFNDFNDIREWRNVYLLSLSESRKRDAELMFTAHGPHRDDLRLTISGKVAKTFASQGQCRSFALALKLGSSLLLERYRGEGMIFLIDDAVSELDPGRTSRVYPLIEGRGQIFIATPKCQADLGAGVMRCVVEGGRIAA